MSGVCVSTLLWFYGNCHKAGIIYNKELSLDIPSLPTKTQNTLVLVRFRFELRALSKGTTDLLFSRTSIPKIWSGLSLTGHDDAFYTPVS